MNSSVHKIKIAFITVGLGTGGAEMMLWKLLSGMDRSLFEPVVVVLGKLGPVAEKIEALGVPVYCLGMSRTAPWKAFSRLVKLLRDLRPAVLQGWMYHGNLSAQMAAPFVPGPKTVLWSVRHSLHSLKHEKKATAAIILLCSRLSGLPAAIVYNSATSSRTHEALGYRSDRSVVIPNGFDTSVFAPSAEARRKMRVELGVNEDCLLVGLIGRYHPVKDHATFLCAAGRLALKYPEVHFVLAGEGVDKSNSKLMSLIDENGLSGAVHLLGRRDDLAYVTAALDIASSASYSESFANVIGEAMSCAVPCVVTDVGDSALIVGNTGEVVPPRDPVVLATGWEKMIKMDRKGRERLGQMARQRIIDVFSMESIIKRYEELYKSAGSKASACVA